MLQKNQRRGGYHDKQKVFKSNQVGPFSRWGSHLSIHLTNHRWFGIQLIQPSILSKVLLLGRSHTCTKTEDKDEKLQKLAWNECKWWFVMICDLYFVNNLCCLSNVQQLVHAFTLHASFFGTQLTSISFFGLTASPESHPKSSEVCCLGVQECEGGPDISCLFYRFWWLFDIGCTACILHGGFAENGPEWLVSVLIDCETFCDDLLHFSFKHCLFGKNTAGSSPFG